ncbi:hypothetical protein F5Y16DRAFT_390690 [Xylariaceae sp. FL0255]|nr:hypothetical protein F5Y16DRAFT_390690 [Xylariaceae sp. FL0255]
MPAFSSLAAATLLLASTSYAIPQPTRVQPRQTTNTLAPWVTVGSDGSRSTVTPVLSTVDGTPTVVNGAPHDLTATDYTTTTMGEILTSTAAPPAPTTTNTDGAGSFSVCNNLDGDLAPWCQPAQNDTLYVGTTYYFTWDPNYFNSSVSNTSIQIVGNFVNETTGETNLHAFNSSTIQAGWGFWTMPVTSDLLRYQGSQNISVTLFALTDKKITKQGPVITVRNRPGYAPNHGGTPSGKALTIALPTVFGFVLLCVIGGCLWNRKARRIELGNVMSRSRQFGGLGSSGKSRFRRAKRAEQRIQLMEREVRADGGEVYRDMPEPPARPRRDSGDLGSLAGTPTDERQMRFPNKDVAPSGNAFRDELKRQHDERFI